MMDETSLDDAVTFDEVFPAITYLPAVLSQSLGTITTLLLIIIPLATFLTLVAAGLAWRLAW